MAAAATEIATGINNSSSTTYTIPVATAAAVGDLVIVFASHDATGALSATAISDATDGVTFGSNTWAQSDLTSWGSPASRASIYYSVLTSAMTAGTSLVRFTSGGSTHKMMQIVKLAGSMTQSLDKIKNGTTANNQASTASPVSGTTLTTTQSVELVVALWGYNNSGGTPTFTLPAGFSAFTTTQQTATGSICSVSTGYKLVAATGTQGGTATLSAAQTAGGCVATFKYADLSAPSGGTETLSGTAQVGSTLTCTSASWSPAVDTYSYTWKRADDTGFTTNVTTIQGPVSSALTTNTYTLVGGDNSKYIRCYATATNGGGTSASANTSSSSQILQASPVNVTPPVAAGLVSTGQVLTVDNGVWNPA
jgi:hypothetical protein